MWSKVKAFFRKKKKINYYYVVITPVRYENGRLKKIDEDRIVLVQKEGELSILEAQHLYQFQRGAFCIVTFMTKITPQEADELSKHLDIVSPCTCKIDSHKYSNVSIFIR